MHLSNKQLIPIRQHKVFNGQNRSGNLIRRSIFHQKCIRSRIKLKSNTNRKKLRLRIIVHSSCSIYKTNTLNFCEYCLKMFQLHCVVLFVCYTCDEHWRYAKIWWGRTAPLYTNHDTNRSVPLWTPVHW